MTEMTDIENMTQEERDAAEKRSLLERARLMGLNPSGNIGLVALRQKIQDAMDGKEDQVPDTAEANPFEEATTTDVPIRRMTLQEYQQKEQLALIRCRVSNMDPKKADLPGEVLTVANEYLGTVRKFIPFGEFTDGGYHIPKILLEMMQARKFLHIRTRRDPVTKQEVQESNWVKEFAIEILDPLNEEEIHNLAQAQLASGSTVENSLA